MLKKVLGSVVLAIAFFAMPAFGQSGKVEVLWLGQAAFRIVTPGGKVIVTDPWLLKNPITPDKYKNIVALGDMKLIAEYYKPDLVLMPIGGHFTMDPADAA